MIKKTKAKKPSPSLLEKVPSGVSGLDEITYGGLPKIAQLWLPLD
jgi:hypothetical protein